MAEGFDGENADIDPGVRVMEGAGNEFAVAGSGLECDVPRDREWTFELQIVKKRQRRLNGVDEIVLSAEIYGASVPKETISRITTR